MIARELGRVMDKIILSTIANMLETSVGIWIFGRVFSRRERYGIPQRIAGWIWYSLMSFVIGWNFLGSQSVFIKIAGYLAPVLLYFLCRLFTARKAGIQIWEHIFLLVLFALMTGLLAWNSQFGYISNLLTILGGVFTPFCLFVLYQCKGIQAYLWGFFYLSSIGIFKAIYFVYESQTKNLEWVRDSKLCTYGSIFYEYAIVLFIILLVYFGKTDELLKRLFHQYKKIIFFIAAGFVCATSFMMYLAEYGFTTREAALVLGILICLVLSLLFVIAGNFLKAEQTEKRLLEVRNTAVE